jgi:plastocyanin
MGRDARRLLFVLLALAAAGSGVLAGLAIAATEAHPTVVQHRRKRHCFKREHGVRKRVRCPRHHAAAKHSTSTPKPSGTSTTGSTTNTPGTGAPTAGTPPPVSGGETPVQSKPTEVPHVEVTAVEYKFTLSRTTVPAGKVILQFVNKGMDEHNLNVLGGEGELASSFANEQSGGISEQAVTFKAGSYMLFCSLPEHEAKGMKATLVVE